MNNLRERLVDCFTTVFPTLTAETAVAATADSVAEWDSTHHIILMNVLEEAFNIEIPEEALGEIDSFAGFERYLAQLHKPA
jgi:acyl carrier protein